MPGGAAFHQRGPPRDAAASHRGAAVMPPSHCVARGGRIVVPVSRRGACVAALKAEAKAILTVQRFRMAVSTAA